MQPRSKSIILIVDDNPKNLQVLGNVLKPIDCELSLAFNGKESYERALSIHPDLILLDIMMPDMDGYEVCAQLKSNEETRDIPVIFITAKTQIDDIVHGFEAGAVDYITKPFNTSELLARVKTHLELRQIREQLEEANAAKDKFFSIIAHDLRSPFTTIASFIRLITKNIDTLEKTDILKLSLDLKHSTDKTQALLDNLLWWARAHTGQLIHSPQSINAARLFNETITVMQQTADEKGISLENTIPEHILVSCDRHMVNTAIRNLVSNAIKFTRQDGKVIVSAVDTRDHVEFLIADNGVGMSENIKNSIFKVDSKITTKGTADEKGSGLGLLLCKEFIELNGGQIWVESIPDKGTTFHFTLPAPV